MIAEPPHRILQAHTLNAAFTRRLILHTYDLVHLWLTVTAVTGAPSAGTLDAKVQYTDPINGDGVTPEWIDVPGAAFAQVTKDTAFPKTQLLVLEAVDLASPYMRVTLTPAFTGGTSPSFTTTLGYSARRLG